MKKAIHTATAMLLFSAVAMCAADPFPLQFGNTWTYREATTGDEFTVRVGTPLVMDDRVYYSLSGYLEQRLYVRINDTGGLYFLDEETGNERLLTSFEQFEGGWWFAPFRLPTECEWSAQTMLKRGTHEGPAGPIPQVLETRYRGVLCADVGVVSEQYAENIGMVRRVMNSIAGPREYNLVSARIGKQIIEAHPHGRMTVSVADMANSATMTAKLRLELAPSDLVLRFPTAQEYDVVLKDETGSVIWKWSDGQMFDQAFHELNVTSEWTVKIAIPRPTTGGKYTLQAWLTTATDAPQFAATFPIEIAAKQ